MSKIITAKLRLPAPVPSKKNNRRNYGSQSLPSKNHEIWHQFAMEQLAWDGPAFSKVISIEYLFTMGDLKDRDIDNAITSVQDFLKDAEVITDDNWKVMPKGSWDTVYIKDTWGVEVTINGYQ